MFKKFIIASFIVLIPACVLSFIIGGVLNIFLGQRQNGYYNQEYVDSSYYDDEAKRWTVSDTTRAYDFSIGARENLTFQLSGVNAIIMSSYGDEIYVSVKNENADRDAEVVLTTEGNTSTIEVHPTNITFNPMSGGGLVSWLEDMFGSSPKCSVWIVVPQQIYQTLTVQQGSGNVTISNVNARVNRIDIGAGNFDMVRDLRNKALSIDVNLGSGKAVLKNSNTENYTFNIGSGEFEARALSGIGNVNIGSGSVTLSYSDFRGIFLEKGSGTLNMLIPPLTSSRVIAELGSGKIDVATDSANLTYTESGEYIFGDESTVNFIRVTNGSGNIYVKNNSGDDFVDVPLIPDGLKDSAESSETEYSSSFSAYSSNSSDSSDAAIQGEEIQSDPDDSSGVFGNVSDIA
ncbi:MAG: DUF4097 family beta strand repeat protein [Oscillospiraceae bacterium]|nr:DUF4097 family beta strand repeat protein [Oscillospiraceae bacterium]